ncbi:hypothetical protein [Runella aurantiaca]|uniref:Uncharacterized protein n=1 Tax=Runella aurantiaca TaxID=2282308 RepID=A0A369I1M1_9BACT|nr:hypothetical protein [Runella aurantiaca]RDB03691.1 hypothetical protein DVG78_22545 [Runella aurantiaca]
MNSNFKFLGALVLIGLAMFVYEEYKAQQREDAFFNQFKANSYSQQNPASQAYNPNAITNYEFGFSIPILADLTLVPTAAKYSYFFVDKKTESRSDIIMVIPTIDDLNTVAQNLQSAGTPFTKTENTVTATISTQEMAATIIFGALPDGSVLGVMRIITGPATISQKTAEALGNGIRFIQPTVSLEERQKLMEMDIENQKIANRRRDVDHRSATDGDLLMARVQSVLDRCYACDGF